MKKMLWKRGVYFFAASAVVAGLSCPPPTQASPSGLAWDSVTKLVTNTDPSSLTPGSFDQDYAQAAAVQPPPDSGGGLFGKINAAVSMGRQAEALMQNGLAQKYYVAGTKERTDFIANQTATIVDCSARSITTLNLRKKTYRVESMDAPSSGSGNARSPSAPGPRPTDDGTRIAITIANSSLGTRNVSGQPTAGYKSAVTFTETKPSGEAHTQNGDLVAYYSPYANPTTQCSHQNVAHGFSAMAGGYARLAQALAVGGADRRVTIEQSGPPLPLGRLAMYLAMTFTGRGGGATFLTERGNIRAVSVNDSAFGIPTDFTRER